MAGSYVLRSEFTQRVLDGATRLVRTLPTDVAWKVFDARDLDALDSVLSVKDDLQGIEITYRTAGPVCTLDSLRRLLKPAGAGGLWRMAGFAHDIAEQLLLAHENGIPQLVVSPDRIGLAEGGLVLLPTLAPLRLPHLDLVLGTPPSEWVHYAAPEVFRVRGCPTGKEGEAERSDVCSLGYLLAAVCDTEWDPKQQDPFMVAEKRVEQGQNWWPWHLPTNLQPLGEILAALSRHHPEARLPLVKASEQFLKLREANSPEMEARRLAGNPDGLEALLQDLDGPGSPFAVDEQWRALVKADQALARRPPDPALALSSIESLGRPFILTPPAQLRIARANAARNGGLADLEKSMMAYAMAAAVSQSSPAIIAEWEAFLESIQDPGVLLGLTGRIELADRPPFVIRTRVNACVRSGRAFEGWTELSTCLQRVPPGDYMMDFARKTLASVPPDLLTDWLTKVRALPRMAAARAVACEKLGLTDLAKKNHAEHASLAPPAST